MIRRIFRIIFDCIGLVFHIVLHAFMLIFVIIMLIALLVVVAHAKPIYQKHPILNKRDGVCYYDDGFGNGPHKETYYNLPMKRVCQNAKDKGIYGEYWETEDGLKMYGYFIICAANYEVHPYGSIVLTSHGPGKVLDTGGFAATNPTQIDIATCW